MLNRKHGATAVTARHVTPRPPTAIAGSEYNVVRLSFPVNAPTFIRKTNAFQIVRGVRFGSREGDAMYCCYGAKAFLQPQAKNRITPHDSVGFLHSPPPIQAGRCSFNVTRSQRSCAAPNKLPDLDRSNVPLCDVA